MRMINKSLQTQPYQQLLIREPRNFCVPRPPEFRLDFRQVLSKEVPPRPAKMQKITLSGDIPAWIREVGEELWFWRPGLALFLNFEKKVGKVDFFQPRDWQNVLRIIYFHLFFKQDGLLLHSSGMTRNNHAYIFPGPSGAGKTTIIRNSPGEAVLSDEMVAIRITEGEVVGYGTPFYGDWGTPGERVSAPVRGLYFPCHSHENRLISLKPAEILNRLLPCICCYTNRSEIEKELFELAVKLAGMIPGYDLHFCREANFWEILNAS